MIWCGVDKVRSSGAVVVLVSSSAKEDMVMCLCVTKRKKFCVVSVCVVCVLSLVRFSLSLISSMIREISTWESTWDVLCFAEKIFFDFNFIWVMVLNKWVSVNFIQNRLNFEFFVMKIVCNISFFIPSPRSSSVIGRNK